MFYGLFHAALIMQLICGLTIGQTPEQKNQNSVKFTIIINTSFKQICSDFASLYGRMQNNLYGMNVTIDCRAVGMAKQRLLLTAKTQKDAAAQIAKDFQESDVPNVILFIHRTKLTAAEMKKFGSNLMSYPMIVNGALLTLSSYDLKNAMIGTKPSVDWSRFNRFSSNFTLSQKALFNIMTGITTTFDDPEIRRLNPTLDEFFRNTTGALPAKDHRFKILIRPGRMFSTEIFLQYLEEYAVDVLAKSPQRTPAEEAAIAKFPIVNMQAGGLVQFDLDRENAELNATMAQLEKYQLGPPEKIKSPVDPKNPCRICLGQDSTDGLGMTALLAQKKIPMLAILPQEEIERYGSTPVKIENRDGVGTVCNQKSMVAAVKQATAKNSNIVNLSGNETYPILGYVELSILKTELGQEGASRPKLPDCLVLAHALNFVNWLIDDSNTKVRQVLLNNFFVLGPEAFFRPFIEAQQTMRCGENKALVRMTLEAIQRRERLIDSFRKPTTWVALFLGLIGGAIATYFASRVAYVRLNRLHRESLEHYSISSKKIKLTPSYLSPVDRFKGVVASRKVVDRHIPSASIQCISTGTYGSVEVFLRPCSLVIHRLRRDTRLKILELMEELKHPHVVPFLGMTELQQGRCLVCSFCPFGDLRTLIIAKHYDFAMNTKFSLAGDIAEGMDYIHRKGFVHGNLRSCAVYIEADWSARVSDFEYDTLHQVQGTFKPTVVQLKQKLNLYQQTSLYPWLYWTSPEILRQGITGREVPPEPSADIYSFGIVCAEIFSMTPAYQAYQELPYKLTPAQILNGILSADMRPRENWNQTTTPHCVLRMMEFCWQEDPTHRPSFSKVATLLRTVRSLRRHVADKIMIAAERQCEQLEKRLESAMKKITRLDDEFHRLSKILLPPSYWRTIYKQKLYTSMTRHELGIIFYCSLVSYEQMLDPERASKAVECLNLLHKGFQNILDTGGRVYRMYRNGSTFVALGNVPYGVKEDPIDSIARLAFDFMTWAWRVKVPGNLMDGFQLQIGIHSGPMAAGTLKYSTNHYIPLGPTLREGWNICKSSAPCRILISEEFHQNLRQLAQIFIKYRIIRNKENIHGYKRTTYWLVGMNYYPQQSLLDEIFELDPENMEAIDKLRKLQDRKEVEKKGTLRNELVRVVSALPFDYQAMKSGGQQYIVDAAEKERRSTTNIALEGVAQKVKNPLKFADSLDEPLNLEPVDKVTPVLTQGHRQLPPTIKWISADEAKDLKVEPSKSNTDVAARKHEEAALRHLKHLRKQEQELLDRKKQEHEHLMQLHHNIVVAAQQAAAAPTTIDDLREIERNMDAEITIIVPTLPHVAHLGTTAHGPTDHATTEERTNAPPRQRKTDHVEGKEPLVSSQTHSVHAPTPSGVMGNNEQSNLASRSRNPL